MHSYAMAIDVAWRVTYQVASSRTLIASGIAGHISFRLGTEALFRYVFCIATCCPGTTAGMAKNQLQLLPSHEGHRPAKMATDLCGHGELNGRQAGQRVREKVSAEGRLLDVLLLLIPTIIFSIFMFMPFTLYVD